MIAVVGTVTVNCVDDAEVMLAMAFWADPANHTVLFDTAGPKSVPVMTTVVSAAPLVGVKLVIVGGGMVTVKLLLVQTGWVPWPPT